MLSLTFPRAGDVHVLTRVPALRRPVPSASEEDPNVVRIAVLGGRPRDSKSAVARCVGVVVA